MGNMQIIGHRGAKGLAPENSIESIRRALQTKVDAIEIDVRMQQGSVVLSHDPTVRGEIYCPIRQALQEINSKVPIILDIKDKSVIKPLISSLKNYNGELIYSSHKFRLLSMIKQLVPDAELAVIEKWSGVRAIAEATLLDTRRIHINHSWLWSKFVASAIKEGYELYAYTVNDPARAQELRQWGIHGIFTDYPDRIKAKN